MVLNCHYILQKFTFKINSYWKLMNWKKSKSLKGTLDLRIIKLLKNEKKIFEMDKIVIDSIESIFFYIIEYWMSMP